MPKILSRPWTWPALVRLVVGLVLFGLGIGVMVVAGLGLPPWDVLHQGIADLTPLTIGVVGILVGVLLLGVMVPLRERIGLGTALNVLVIGLVVDATVAWVPSGGRAIDVAMMLSGPLLVGVGSGFYIGADLGPGPRDAIMTAMAARGWRVQIARWIIEAVVLAAGWALGGTVGIGTLWFVLAIGPSVDRSLSWLSPRHRAVAGRPE